MLSLDVSSALRRRDARRLCQMAFVCVLIEMPLSLHCGVKQQHTVQSRQAAAQKPAKLFRF